VWGAIVGASFFSLLVIVALYLGHRSSLDIHRRPTELKGKTIAFLGLVCSYMLLLGGLLALLPTVLRSRQAKAELAAVCNLKAITYAENSYASKGRGYGSLDELIDAKLLDSRFTEAAHGYEFTVVSSGREYTAFANPISQSSGHGYSATTDGIVRYSTNAPAGMAGKPVE
jgi:hypothetical protein